MYLKPCDLFMMKFFCGNSEQLLAVDYFHKNVPSLMFYRVRNTSLYRLTKTIDGFFYLILGILFAHWGII